MALKPLLDIALDWGRRSFGDQMDDTGTRALRVLEEVTELCQSVRVPQDKAKQCVDEVYKRPRGETPQEIGGVLMTIYLFIASRGHLFGGNDPEEYFVTELRRVLSKSVKHFQDRNQEKINLGLQVESSTHAGGNAAIADPVREY